jgi:hypothetical protein
LTSTGHSPHLLQVKNLCRVLCGFAGHTGAPQHTLTLFRLLILSLSHLKIFPNPRPAALPAARLTIRLPTFPFLTADTSPRIRARKYRIPRVFEMLTVSPPPYFSWSLPVFKLTGISRPSLPGK